MAKTKLGPYDLTTADTTGSIITQVQLKGESNYDEWARAIKTALRARRKWRFIDGSVEKPKDNADNLDDWWTVQSMIVTWLMNTIEPALQSTMSYSETAKVLWDDLKGCFSISNGPRIQQIKSELAECKQRGLTVVDYYAKIKKLWDDLANYDQSVICSCGKCTCEVNQRLQRKRDEERVHEFLMGLEDSIFGTTRSNLLATDPLPNLNRVYSTMIQEERVKGVIRAAEERKEIMALATQTSSKGRGRGDSRSRESNRDLFCTHCKRSGHDVGGCFQIIGYPEWWGDRPQGKRSSSGRGGGGGGGRGRVEEIRANAVHTSHIEGSSSASTTENGKDGAPTITEEQWQTLIGLLQNQKMKVKDA